MSRWGSRVGSTPAVSLSLPEVVFWFKMCIRDSSVDFALVNRVKPGDAVVSQDYGLASMCLAKCARVLLSLIHI